MQLRLAIIYQKKSKFQDSDQCFKNFADSYESNEVKNMRQTIDQEYPDCPLFIELKVRTPFHKIHEILGIITAFREFNF